MAKATIETAFPLEGNDLAELDHRARAPLRQKVEATVVVKPELIGGARITVGDNVIDGTVQERCGR